MTWELLYFNFMHDFPDKYGAYTVEKLRASGASPAAVQAQIRALDWLQRSFPRMF